MQLDGKVYWSGNAGDRDSASGLMVPPGPHVFRVLVGAGGAQRASGNLNGDFVAKKKLALKVKLWPEPANGVTFDPASQVIISLQKSMFPL